MREESKYRKRLHIENGQKLVTEVSCRVMF